MFPVPSELCPPTNWQVERVILPTLIWSFQWVPPFAAIATTVEWDEKDIGKDDVFIAPYRPEMPCDHWIANIL